MQDAGLLASDWADVNGRRRRTYRITREGRGALDAERTAWRQFTAAVGMVLEGGRAL